MEQRRGLSEAQFIRRVLIVIALVALTLLLWALRDVLLMVFGAVVVSTLFLSLAAQFQRLRVPPGLALALSVLTIFTIVGGAMALFGAQLTAQTTSLSEAVPKAWEALQVRLESWGVPIDLAQLKLGGAGSGLAASAGQFVMSLGSGLANVLLIIVGGIFIAASPRFYATGAVKLVPDTKRGLMTEALADSGKALRLWLKAQLVAMVLIGTLTGLGLWMLGVPSALALALLAGLLEFVPYVGPIIAAIPAVLIAFAIDPQLGLWTVLLYVLIQNIEGYAVQPLIQSWAVEVPGAVLLFALLACGGLFGPLGIVFAAPLTVVVYVLIKRLYVREALDTPTPIPGEDQPEPAPAA
uniref:AI-2E family transporter n=1 Tax=uncultured Sphingomonas sp. TaxID=158754 RepID=UPI0025F3126D|nr:AI-2E family transporter [uncultured Sphingomonas sp.]